ncbi:MAG: hypothetical protein AB1649_22475 [Chloroflexota bacterium]
MKNFLNVVAKILAVLCAILFVAAAVAALLLFNLERKLFNAQTYKQALANQNFYERLPALVAQTLASPAASANPCQENPIACGSEERSAEGNACFEGALGSDVYQEISSFRRNPTDEELRLADSCLRQYGLDQAFEAGGPPEFMSNLKAEDWEFIVSSLLPPEDLKQMTEQGLDSIMAFLNRETDSATLSLAPLKTRLNSEAGVELVLQMMNAQPDCTEAELREMGLAMLSEPKMPMCKPPAELTEVVKPLIQGQLQTVAAQIPDRATLIPSPASEEADPRGGLITIRLAMRLTPIVALFFLLGVTVFAVRSLKNWLNWWGIPFVIAGGPSALMGYFGTSVLLLFLQNKMIERMPAQMPVSAVSSANDLISAVVRQLVKPVVWQGILLAVLGAGMIAFSIYQSRREASKAPENAVTPTVV